MRLNGFYPVNASGLFMPLLYDPNSLWIATVTESYAAALTAEEPAQKARTK